MLRRMRQTFNRARYRMRSKRKLHMPNWLPAIAELNAVRMRAPKHDRCPNCRGIHPGFPCPSRSSYEKEKSQIHNPLRTKPAGAQKSHAKHRKGSLHYLSRQWVHVRISKATTAQEEPPRMLSMQWGRLLHAERDSKGLSLQIARLSEPLTLRKPRISLYKTPFVGKATRSVNESDCPKSGMCNRNRRIPFSCTSET